MSIYNKLDLTGWKPRQLTSQEVRFATWIAFFAWVFAVYDFILFGTLLPEIGRHFGWGEVEQAEIATWVAVAPPWSPWPSALSSTNWGGAKGLFSPWPVRRCVRR